MKILKWIQWCKRDRGVVVEAVSDGYEGYYQGDGYYHTTEIELLKLIAHHSDILSYHQWLEQSTNQNEH